MSKFGTFGDYPKESLPSAEAALLTAWRSLDRYHEGLVLVGENALLVLIFEPNCQLNLPEAGGRSIRMASPVPGSVVERISWSQATSADAGTTG